MNLSPLLRLFNQIPAYNTLADALHIGELARETRHPLGVLTAARPALLAALQTDLKRPLLFITARADRARILTEQIQAWLEDPARVYRLPDPDSLPHERVAWGSETIQGRLAALSALVAYKNDQLSVVNGQASTTHPPLVVISARALMSQTLPPDEFTLMKFREGQQINLNQVVGQWVALGYQPEEVVEVPGSFSRRGGILDIFPPSAAMPIRIELFGDEIDSLRHFDPVTQRSEARLKNFTVGPAIEPLPRYAERAAAQLSQWDLTNLQPSAKIAFEEDVARLASGATFRGIEYYLPFFYNGLMKQGEEETRLRPEAQPEGRRGHEGAKNLFVSSPQSRRLRRELSRTGL
jgi:transcription-repair coupling factor (superfamily II helicase)